MSFDDIPVGYSLAISIVYVEVWVHKNTSLTKSLFIEPVPSQESARSCICVLGVSMLTVSTIVIFDFGVVPTLWYSCLLFNFVF